MPATARQSGNRFYPDPILTVSKDIKTKIDGFNAGADDYLVKPFDLQS